MPIHAHFRHHYRSASSMMDFHWLATIAFLCLPGTLVGLLTMTKPFGCCEKWSLDWRPSDQVWRQEKSAQDPSIPAIPIFVLKDILETPHIPIYAILVILALLSVFHVRRDVTRLRVLLFRLIFVILFIIRVLSSASGTILVYKELQMLPWDSASPLTAWFLHWIINLSPWDGSYLSRYCDIAPSTPQLSWRDAIIRLAYYHILDNAIHVIWLRFFWPINNGEPFTQYVNNSEILTIVLLISMVAWTWLRVRRRDCASEMELVPDAEKGRTLVAKVDTEGEVTTKSSCSSM